MSDLDRLQAEIIRFRDERNWQQFHKPKDLAISLVLEATEFMEHFQWKSDEEVEKHLREHKSDAADELIDTLYWVLLIAHDLHIDIEKAFKRKMAKNVLKYPVEKSSGNHDKYTDLQKRSRNAREIKASHT